MLEVKDLVFHPLDNGVEKSIIENISFTVNDGEMLVITGPNGGGKSTVANTSLFRYFSYSSLVSFRNTMPSIYGN